MDRLLLCPEGYQPFGVIVDGARIEAHVHAVLDDLRVMNLQGQDFRPKRNVMTGQQVSTGAAMGAPTACWPMFDAAGAACQRGGCEGAMVRITMAV